jgi:hypothetical protein
MGLSFFRNDMISLRKIIPIHKRLHPNNDRGSHTEGENPNFARMISSRKLSPSHNRLRPTNDRGAQIEGENPNSARMIS